MWEELANLSQCLVTTVNVWLAVGVHVGTGCLFNSNQIEYNINTAKSACPLCD